MVDVSGILDAVGIIASPFLKNPTLVYLLVLLVIGGDAFVSLGSSIVPDNLPDGTVYIIDQDFFGNKVCSTTTSVALAEQLGVVNAPHIADSKEMMEICNHNENVQGTVGRVFTSILAFIGVARGLSFFGTITVYSWELFIWMILIPLFWWAITSSTRS